MLLKPHRLSNGLGDNKMSGLVRRRKVLLKDLRWYTFDLILWVHAFLDNITELVAEVRGIDPDIAEHELAHILVKQHSYGVGFRPMRASRVPDVHIHSGLESRDYVLLYQLQGVHVPEEIRECHSKLPSLSTDNEVYRVDHVTAVVRELRVCKQTELLRERVAYAC